MISIPYTAIPQREVIIHPSTGASSYAVIDTDSYLSANLHGQMQNAAPYIGWSLEKWIQAITADAQQRCASYPESCAGTTPEQLGIKWGTISFNLMQGYSASVQTPQSTQEIPQGATLVEVSPGVYVYTSAPQATVPAAINVPISGQDPSTLKPTGWHLPFAPLVQQGDGSVPVPHIPLSVQTQAYYNNPGFYSPSLSPNYVTQQNASSGAVSDNQSQSTLANSGGNPVAPVVPPGTFVLPASLSFLGNTISIMGFNVPIWMLGAGAIGLMMLNQNKGRR